MHRLATISEHCIVVSVLAVSLAACSEVEQRSDPGAKTEALASASIAASATTGSDGRMLSWDDAPAGVRTAVMRMAPDFIPWSPLAYPNGPIRSTRSSPNAGLSIARGHLRTEDCEDYVLLGYDRRLHGIRILAALSERGKDTFRVISISDGPERPDSLAAVPDRYLEIDSTHISRQSTLIVQLLRADAGTITQRFAWEHTRGRFVLVEPN